MSSPVYGWQSAAWQLSRAALERGAHALLLAGARGCGKREFALALAASYLCVSRVADAGACGTCESCRWLAAGTHPDFALVEPITDDDETEANASTASKRAKTIAVDQIRQLTTLLSISAHRDAGKVIVIHPAEAMNSACANALLKNLEEPPPRAIFLLVSHRPALLLPTVRSRCQLVAMRVEDASSAQAWVAANTSAHDPGLLLALAGGAPLAAVAIDSDPAWARRESFFRALAAPQADPIRIAESYRELAPALVLLWLQSWTFDLVQMRFCGLARYHRDLQSSVAGVAQSIDPIATTRLHRRLVGLQRHVNHPLNARLLVEYMLIAYCHAVGSGGTAP